MENSCNSRQDKLPDMLVISSDFDVSEILSQFLPYQSEQILSACHAPQRPDHLRCCKVTSPLQCHTRLFGSMNQIIVLVVPR